MRHPAFGGCFFGTMAEFGDWTALAFWANGRAARLTKRDEMTIPGLPIFNRQNLAQGEFCISWSCCIYETEPITNAMDMSIDTNCRQIKSNRDCKIGGLSANARQTAKLLDSPRQDTAKFSIKRIWQRLELFRLFTIKADRIYEGGDFIF